MIPVTIFAGKTVAVFGLGGSGLMSARALKAGGAEVIACDDDPKKMAEPTNLVPVSTIHLGLASKTIRCNATKSSASCQKPPCWQISPTMPGGAIR